MNLDEFVRHFIRLIENKDLDGACALMSDDCEYDNVPMNKVFGPEAVHTMLTPFMAGASEIEWIIHRQAASGDMTSGVVLNERTDRFKMSDKWIEIPLAGIFEVKNGKISLWRDYFDLAMFQKSLAG
jgi:limonene-1,2-epoxide hydrolase